MDCFPMEMDGSVDFYRGWNDYEEGFGNLQFEFWLGLSKLHRITQLGVAKLNTVKVQTRLLIIYLRVDLESFDEEILLLNTHLLGLEVVL